MTEVERTIRQWDATIAIILIAYPKKDKAWAKSMLWRALRNTDGPAISLVDLLEAEFGIKVEIEK